MNPDFVAFAKMAFIGYWLGFLTFYTYVSRRCGGMVIDASVTVDYSNIIVCHNLVHIHVVSFLPVEPIGQLVNYNLHEGLKAFLPVVFFTISLHIAHASF